MPLQLPLPIFMVLVHRILQLLLFIQFLHKLALLAHVLLSTWVLKWSHGFPFPSQEDLDIIGRETLCCGTLYLSQSPLSRGTP